MKLKKLLSLLLSVMMILVMFNSLIVVSAADGSSVIVVPLTDSTISWFSNEWANWSGNPGLTYVPTHSLTYWNRIGARCSGTSGKYSNSPTKDDETKESYKLISAGYGMMFDETKIPDADFIKSATVKVKVKSSGKGYSPDANAAEPFKHNTFLYPMDPIVRGDFDGTAGGLKTSSGSDSYAWHNFTTEEFIEAGLKDSSGTWVSATDDNKKKFVEMYNDVSGFTNYPNITNLVAVDEKTFDQVTASTVFDYDVTDHIKEGKTPNFILINDNKRDNGNSGWENNSFSLDTTSSSNINTCATLEIVALTDAEVLEAVKTADDTKMPKYLNYLFDKKGNEMLKYNRLSDTDKNTIHTAVKSGTFTTIDDLKEVIVSELAKITETGIELKFAPTDATLTWYDSDRNLVPLHSPKKQFYQRIGAQNKGNKFYSVGYGMMFDKEALPDSELIKNAYIEVDIVENGCTTNDLTVNAGHIFKTALYPMAPIERGNGVATYMVANSKSDGNPNNFNTACYYKSWVTVDASVLEGYTTTGDDNQTKDVVDEVKIWNWDKHTDYTNAYKDVSGFTGYPNLTNLESVVNYDFPATRTGALSKDNRTEVPHTLKYDVTEYIKDGNDLNLILINDKTDTTFSDDTFALAGTVQTDASGDITNLTAPARLVVTTYTEDELVGKFNDGYKEAVVDAIIKAENIQHGYSAVEVANLLGDSYETYADLVKAIASPNAFGITNVTTSGATITSQITDAKCFVFAAAYKGNKLVEIKESDLTALAKGDNTFNFTFTATDYDTVKVFCWDGLTTIKPLCASETAGE